MAYDPTLPTIQTESGERAQPTTIVRTLEYDFGTFVIEETSMDLIWPEGDPCPRDKETLIVFLERHY